MCGSGAFWVVNLVSCSCWGHVIKYCEKVYERSGGGLFWSIGNSGEVLDKLGARGFGAAALSACGFSALCAALPRGLIGDELVGLVEGAFQGEGSPCLACSGRGAFLLQKNLKNIMHGRVGVCAMR